MKDYSELSNFEINKAVGELTGEATSAEPTFEMVIRNANGRRFDPCKNIDDAWKIIAENRINVEWHEMKDDTFKPYALSNETMIGYYDDSALRAAMIVFLMMKDMESSHG